MRVSDILRRKGDFVATIDPAASIRQLVELLVEHNIGAAVVCAAEGELSGIVSERDVVRSLGSAQTLLDGPVAQIMTANVVTVTPSATVEELARLMTEHRIRHVPVLLEGRLAGLVSIGDVVKSRLGELEVERDSLVNYISSAQ